MSVRDNLHRWGNQNQDGVRACNNQGCAVRVKDSFRYWQPEARARWRPCVRALIPECSGHGPIISPAPQAPLAGQRKPWETTLQVGQFTKDRRCLTEANGTVMVAVLRAQEAEEWEKFLQAAPLMARALLPMAARPCEDFLPLKETCLNLSQNASKRCPTCAARAALSAAGVPLP